MYIDSTVLDRVMKAHEECTSDCIKGKTYSDGMKDARKLVAQMESSRNHESEWFKGTNELFCHSCGKGVKKPKKGERYDFCPYCGLKMKTV